MPHSLRANNKPASKGLVPNRYQAIIALIFGARYQPGLMAFEFSRDDIVAAAESMAVALPKNIGDIVYSVRYRTELGSMSFSVERNNLI
jgi:hypothetical protein